MYACMTISGTAHAVDVQERGDRFARAAATNLRYTKEAFWFVREAVDRASKVQSPPTRHVTAKELLEALQSLALERYGLTAREVGL